ncbi:PTS sugar transporter subunit IIB [Hominifimenecus sp. rT4P-3]|uniref:PTS sugar transporter subunit IIB n=1 Tax=Hominifimenecus sp. rT4P-3 TaxID=3242979 RepID=UPI003DA2FA94
MRRVELIRVDFRMIHGQVIVKWLKKTGANKIVAINDQISVDPFLADIYKLSAPAGVSIETLSKDDAISYLNADTDANERCLVLLKNVEDAYYCFQNGMPMNHLQIGGLGAGPNRINVYGAITLDNKDAKTLKEMKDAGVEVYFQLVPDENKASLEKILGKYNFNFS